MKMKVEVKPNSRQQKVADLPNGSLIVYLKSSPIKDKANQELI